MSALPGIGFLLSCYLLGSIPVGYLIARRCGVDILRQGSGNIGATNIGRVLGWRLGLLVFGLDFAKGALPAAAGLWLGTQPSSFSSPLPGPADWGVAGGLAAIAGHLFPLFLRFRGGKGVATGAGVVFVLLPGPALGALLIWLTVVAVSRYVSLASLSAAVGLCLLRLALTEDPFGPPQRTLTLFCVLAAALVLVRHRSNVVRLLQGNENRLTESPTMLALTKVLHLLAVGLWFGAGFFFSFVVALSLFGTFEGLAVKPANERPMWFPLPPAFARDVETQKDQGTRAAGEAISPLFDGYFLLQGICGVLALLTALAWWRYGATVHQVRVGVLLLGLATVLLGWMLERKVSQLRLERSRARDAVLLAPAPAPADLEAEASRLRSEFGRWHTYSLLLNFLTLLLVTAVMVLAAWLPAEVPGGAGAAASVSREQPVLAAKPG